MFLLPISGDLAAFFFASGCHETSPAAMKKSGDADAIYLRLMISDCGAIGGLPGPATIP